MYKTEVLKPNEVKMSAAELKHWNKRNEDLCDTAGYVPMAVRMQRMIESGHIAQFTEDDFDINDYKQMYLSPEMKISPEDDLEEIQSKLELRRQYQAAIIAERSKSNNEPKDIDKTKEEVETEDTTKTTSEE